MIVRRRPDKVYVTWPIRTIAKKDFDSIKKAVNESTDYTYNIKPLIAALPRVPVDAIQSIRGNVIKEKIIRGYARQTRKIAELQAKYVKGVPITDIAREYDFPPLNLLRRILSEQGKYRPAILREVFKDGLPAAEAHLEPADRAQFELAAGADIMIGEAVAAREAQQHEDEFVRMMQRRGFKLTTQAELAAEQQRVHGRAVITPDLLFSEPVEINGKPVGWIDYKDYVGADIDFLKKKVKEQVARYAAEWGPGAVCYTYAVEGYSLGASAQVLTLPPNIRG